MKTAKKRAIASHNYPAVDMEKKGCTAYKSLFKTEDTCSFDGGFTKMNERGKR